MAGFDRARLLADTEAYCDELRPHEELCYVEHRFNEQVIELAKKYNLLGINIDPKYGGRGADAVSYFRALVRIGREGTGVRTFYSGHLSIGAYPIQTWGSDALKQKYLPKAVTGEAILAFGLTEPDAGSNPREMTSTYEVVDGGFILSGVKYLISNGGVATAIVVFAYPTAETADRRISAFVVDTNAQGFAAENLTAKMGMYSSNTAMFEMTNVFVPKENLLGELGDGFRIAMGTLVSGRLSVAAGCLGVIEDCLAEVLHYGQAREQHGKPIGKHQLVQDHIAAIEMHRFSSDAVLMQACEAMQAMKDKPGDKVLSATADILAAKAKFFVTNAAWDAADRAVQVFGGRGWSTLYRPGRHLMDVRVCRIYEGTDEILKLKIASSLLGKDYEAFK
jgi:alkylation response protein AidB-like acyl-CoA dehydrogenase